MPTTASLDERTILLPHPDDIRAAIEAADERARLLRRLLRLALKLRLHLTTAAQLPLTDASSASTAEGARRG